LYNEASHFSLLLLLPAISKGNMDQKQRELKTLHELKKLDHPNILKYISAGVLEKWPSKIKIGIPLTNPPNQGTQVLVILTELCTSTLHQKLLEKKNKASMDETFGLQMRQFALQLASALESIHEKHILHRDLTPFNILIHGDCAKIADYGLSRFIRGQGGENKSVTTDNRRNPYLSPDVRNQKLF